MKYFLDTEFHDHGHGRIDFISIGIVAENGRTFYRASLDYEDSAATPWLRENVIPHLPPMPDRKENSAIAQELIEFVGDDDNIEFWAWYADYDFVVMSSLFGSLVDRPRGWPMYCRDLKQLADFLGNPKIPRIDTGPVHDALADAMMNVHRYHFLHMYKWKTDESKIVGILAERSSLYGYPIITDVEMEELIHGGIEQERTQEDDGWVIRSTIRKRPKIYVVGEDGTIT